MAAPVSAGQGLPSVLTVEQHLQPLCQLLPQLLTGHEATRKPAEQQLLLLEKVPGFCSLLLEILGTASAPIPLRQLAVHELKNTVERQWQPREEKGIGADEKAIVRQRLIHLITEPHKQISTQICVLVARVARFDWPRFWPDLFPVIFNLVQNAAGLPRLRALKALRFSLQSIASRPYSGSRRQLMGLNSKIFDFVASMWQAGNDMILHALSEFSQNRATVEQLQSIDTDALVTLEALRTLDLLVHYGFDSWGPDSPCAAFLRVLLQRYSVIVQARDSVARNPLSKFMIKYMKALSKLFMEALKAHANSFTCLLEPTLTFFFNQIVGNLNNNLKHEKFLVDCMAFMEETISRQEYKEGTAQSAILDAFFTLERQKQLIEVLLTRLFPLTSGDLDEWQNAPEEFIHDAGSDAASERYRPCAENLFLVVLRRNKDVIGPWIVSFLQQTSQTPPTTLEAILLKDACYNAVSLACYELPPYINFPQWYNNQLRQELQVDLQNPSSPWRIIRRRIADVVGNWVLYEPREMRPELYGCLNRLMQEPDVVVRVSAVLAMKWLICDSEFFVEDFVPYLDTAIRGMFHTLQTAELVDTKLQILPVLKDSIEQIGSHIAPYVDGLVSMMAELWNSPDCEPFLRSAIVGVLTKLSDAIGDSSRFYSFLIPVLDYSVRWGGEDQFYILEDGLALWLSVASNATVFTPDLLRLFHHLLTIMTNSIQQISVCMKIVEAYILLGRTDFLQAHMVDLGHMFELLAGDLIDDGAPFIIKPIETLIMLYPNECPPHLEGALSKMVELVLSDSVSDRIATHFMALFGRLLLHSQPFFLAWCNRLNNSPANTSKQNIMVILLTKWAQSFEAMQDLRRRKMAALALIGLLAVPDFAASFPDLCSSIIQECIGVSLDELAGSGPEYRARPDATEDEEEPILDLSHSASIGIQTRQLAFLYQNDPVNNVALHQFIKTKLAECEHLNPQAYANVIRLVEPLVLKQFAEASNV